ncbi:unnamed protein product [Amoebophrya sp. A25]|nr:unnamed protein product [Amoebophrya sp. A25]|eukprot:GSA25T00011717001.1
MPSPDVVSGRAFGGSSREGHSPGIGGGSGDNKGVEEPHNARYYRPRGSCLKRPDPVVFERSTTWNEVMQAAVDVPLTERVIVKGDLHCHASASQKFLRPTETFRSVQVKGRVFFTEDANVSSPLSRGGLGPGGEQASPALRVGTSAASPSKLKGSTPQSRTKPSHIPPLAGGLKRGKDYDRPEAVPYGYRPVRGWQPQHNESSPSPFDVASPKQLPPPEVDPNESPKQRQVRRRASQRGLPEYYEDAVSSSLEKEHRGSESQLQTPDPAYLNVGAFRTPSSAGGLSVLSVGAQSGYSNTPSPVKRRLSYTSAMAEQRRPMEIVCSWSQPDGPFGLFDPALPRKVHTWEPVDFFPAKWHPILTRLEPMEVYDTGKHSTKSFRRMFAGFGKRDKLNIVIREESHYDLDKDLGILKLLCSNFGHITLIFDSWEKFLRPHLDFFSQIPESLTLHIRLPFIKELGRREGDLFDPSVVHRVAEFKKRNRLPNSPRPGDRLSEDLQDRLQREQELDLAAALTEDLRRFDPGDESYQPGKKIVKEVEPDLHSTHYELEIFEANLESLVRILSPWVQGGLQLLRIEMHYGPLPRVAEDIPPDDDAVRGSVFDYDLFTGKMLAENIRAVRTSFDSFCRHFIALNKRAVLFENAFNVVDSKAKFKETAWRYEKGGSGRAKIRLNVDAGLDRKDNVSADEADEETLFFGRKTGNKNFRETLIRGARGGTEGSRTAELAYGHLNGNTHPSHSGLERVV